MERVVKKTLIYTLEATERQYSQVAQNDKTTFTIDINIPICWTVHPSTWKFYNLSESDLMVYFEETPAFATWQAMVILTLGTSREIMPSNTVLKSSYQTLKLFTFISRRPVFKDFVKQFYQIPPDNTSKLYLYSNTHKPYLPCIQVTPDTWATVKTYLCSNAHEFTQVIECNQFFTLEGKHYAVMEIFGNQRILITRAIPETCHIRPKLKSIILQRPRVILPNKQIYVLTCESAFLMQEPSVSDSGYIR